FTLLFFLYFRLRRPPLSPPFPYTTLFRSLHLARLDARRRETCPASDLVVGVQCGGSDAFSGVTANPAVGFATDLLVRAGATVMLDRKSTRLNSSHDQISYAVFCLKKKNQR